MRKLIVIPFFLLCLVVKGTNYYIKNTGNDSNTGLSDAQAWAHHPWMSTWTGSVVLKPGDIVYMKRENNWTITNPVVPFITVEQSGSPGSPITTTAYGTGAAPIIKISTATDQPVVIARGKYYLVFDNLHIQHHSNTFAADRCGIIITDVCHHITFTNNEIDNIPHTAIKAGSDSYYITVGDTNVTSTATPTLYSNNIHDFGYGGVILLGVNPANNESHFFVYYNYIHDGISSPGVDIYGIAFSANPASTAWPKYATARYNRIENISWEGLDTHGGSYIYFLDNYVKNFGSTGLLLSGTPKIGSLPTTCNHYYAERNIFEQTPSEWVKGKEHAFITSFISPSLETDVVSDVYIKDNIMFYTSRPASGEFDGVRIYNSRNLIASGNKIYNGSSNSGSPAFHIDGENGNENVTITNNYIGQWGPGFKIIGTAIKGSLAITKNIVIKPAGNACLTFRNSNISSTGVVTIYNNVFIQDSYSSCIHSDYGIAAGGSVIAKNNILGSATPLEMQYWHWGGTMSGTFICDNNLYWNSSSVIPFYYDGVNRDWTYWTTTLGYDKHGVGPNTDPLFKNSSGTYSQDLDFELPNTSSAVNKGTDVGLTTDYAGNPISGLPDIGAFENQPAIIQNPTYIGSVIENAAPSVIELTYNLALANIVPSSSAFTVTVNSSARSVSSVAISGTKVLLTLASPLAYGNVVTVAYTKPATNPLQTAAGGQAGSISAQTVSNKVAAPAVPVFSDASIENTTPSRVDMTYSLSLANIVPTASAFTVQVNSNARTVSSVAISGTKVLLTLASPVAYANVVTVAYTKPAANPLQTSAGGQAASISAQAVTNRVAVINVAPVVVVTSPETSYSGFVNEIDASSSYDANKDNLSFTWSAPANVPLSFTSGAKIRFLGPVVTESTTVEFTVNVSDGKTSQKKIVPVGIVPYKPELEVANVLSVEASGYYSSNYPHNIIDGNIGTMWSANGIDQWLILELKELFSVQYVMLAFQPGQKKESYFDILGSDDKATWEPILTKSASCDFSGDLQVFDFPASKTGKEFKYVKLAGLGNSADTWNYISELKIYGYRHPNPSFYENQAVKLYPNPAREIINIRIDEPTLSPDFIRIINLTGKVVFQDIVAPDNREFQIPLDFDCGVYIVQLGSDDLTLFTQKLVISN